MTVRIETEHGTTLYLHQAEFVPSMMFGPCIRGWVRSEGEFFPSDIRGDFRAETVREWEICE